VLSSHQLPTCGQTPDLHTSHTYPHTLPLRAAGLTRWGGALFIDLPANVVGSFVMGLIGPSDIVAAATGEPSLMSPFVPCPLLPPW
jgi:hypothetical protein